MGKTLIKAGAVISVDKKIGMLPKGDVLIEDDRIVAVAPSIDAEDAEIVDASGAIVMPGLVNAHIHLWQTVVRGIGADWAGSDYYNYMHAGIATRFTPDDLRLSEYIGGLSQIDSGVTTLFDWCHNNPTPEHTDAALDGLMASGVRALFGHGTVKPRPKPGEKHFSEIPHPRGEIERLMRERFSSSGGLVNLAMCILGPDYSTLEVCRQDFQMAREFDLISSAHVWGRSNRLVAEGYRRIAAENLLNEKHNVVHANYIEDDEIKVLVDAGASITATSIVEIKGHAAPPLIGRVSAAGGRPSIGNDTEAGVTGSMFETMRISLSAQRLFDNIEVQREIDRRKAAGEEHKPENLKVIGSGGGLVDKISVNAMEALEWATVNNARALGMEDRIGSLTPGKKADILLIRRNDLNMAPALNPVQAVVMYATASNVDTVFIDGRRVKQGGRLLNAPDARKVEELNARGRRLLQDAGFPELGW